MAIYVGNYQTSYISVGNNANPNIYLCENMVYPNDIIYSYAITGASINYSADNKLLANASNYFTISGYYCIYENGILKSSQYVSNLQGNLNSITGDFVVKDANNKYRFDIANYGTFDMSDYSSYLTISVVPTMSGATGTTLYFRLQRNVPETYRISRELEVNIEQEEIEPYESYVDVSISGISNNITTYTSGRELIEKTLGEPYQIDVWMGEREEEEYMEFVTTAMTNSNIRVLVPENLNGSYRNMYIKAIYDFYDVHYAGYDYVYQDCYVMDLYYDGDRIYNGDNIYSEGSSEIVIEDYGINNREYSVYISGAGEDEVSYYFEDNCIIFEGITSSMYLGIEIDEESSQGIKAFNIIGS